MTYSNWEMLDNKEKDLCLENNIKPDDYLSLKKQIVIEVARNKAVTESWMKDKSNNLKNVREKVPVLFDFFVRCNLIPQR